MSIKGIRIGVALCGSYCTYSVVIPEIQKMVDAGAIVIPIISTASQTTDSRFGKAQDHIDRIEKITGQKIIRTIVDAEPLGPKNMVDIIVAAPCTGNTLAKLAHAITDTPVLMAIKGHLRNEKPVVLALATNDALGLNMKNIGVLMSTKNIYFVPLGQDNYKTKPNSMVAKMDMIIPTIEEAINGKQIQPVIITY